MAQEKKDETTSNVEEKSDDKRKDKKPKEDNPSKVVIRCLPPSLNEDTFLEQISPVPDHDYLSFVKADLSLGVNAYSRAYINFVTQDDIFIFREKFDGYVFLDAKGNEFTAIVEYAPFPKRPKKKMKPDAKAGTILEDPDYLSFLESLENPELEPAPAPETILDEIEAKEKDTKAAHLSTPLLEYIKRRKEDKRAAFIKAREDRKKREHDSRQMRAEEKRRRREKEKLQERLREKERLKQQAKLRDKKKESQAPPAKVMLLKNPEREKDKRDTQTSDTKNRAKDSRAYSSTESQSESRTAPRSRDESKDSDPKYKDSRSRDYRGRETDADRDRLRDRGGRGKGNKPVRDSRGKQDRDQERDRDRDRDREKDRDRQRDSGKTFSGSQKKDIDRSKGRFSKTSTKGEYWDNTKEQRSSEKGGSPEKTSGREKYSESRRGRDYDKKEDRKPHGRNAKDSYDKSKEKSVESRPNVHEPSSRPDVDKLPEPVEDLDKKVTKTVNPEISEDAKKSEDSKDISNDVKPKVTKPEEGDEKPQPKEVASDSKFSENETDPEKPDQAVDDRRQDRDRSQADDDDGDDLSREKSNRKKRYKDRPERAIYNPGQRAAMRRKEMEARRSKDSPESSQSPEGLE